MRVISCLFTEHNLWLVALAALVCVSGCWVTFRLFERALKSGGKLQRTGLAVSDRRCRRLVGVVHAFRRDARL